MSVQTADHDAMGAMTTMHLPLPPRVPGCPCPEWMLQVDLSLHSYNKRVAMVRMASPGHTLSTLAGARTHAREHGRNEDDYPYDGFPDEYL